LLVQLQVLSLQCLAGHSFPRLISHSIVLSIRAICLEGSIHTDVKSNLCIVCSGKEKHNDVVFFGFTTWKLMWEKWLSNNNRTDSDRVGLTYLIKWSINIKKSVVVIQPDAFPAWILSGGPSRRNKSLYLNLRKTLVGCCCHLH